MSLPASVAVGADSNVVRITTLWISLRTIAKIGLLDAHFYPFILLSSQRSPRPWNCSNPCDHSQSATIVK
jgi:hypothetical protein